LGGGGGGRGEEGRARGAGETRGPAHGAAQRAAAKPGLSLAGGVPASGALRTLGPRAHAPPPPPQITAKAYGAARDTNMTLDEAKWAPSDRFDRFRSL
jgi:hypothetical protein